MKLKATEKAAVDAYKSAEESFIANFLQNDGETITEAKARLAKEREERLLRNKQMQAARQETAQAKREEMLSRREQRQAERIARQEERLSKRNIRHNGR